MQTYELLCRLTAPQGVSGAEHPAAEAAAALLREYGPVEITPLGSVVCRLQPPQENGVHLLLDAHLDQIGMIVTRIEENGFLHVGNCGGLDRRSLSAAAVTVHGSEPVPGVITSTPPHLGEPGDRSVPKVDEILVDTGLCEAGLRRLVRLGDRITVNGAPRRLLGGKIAGAALDDRAGCAALILAAKEIAEARPDFGVTVLLSSMEEVGGQGAQTAAYALNPTHSIVVDVSFALTPDAPREKCGKLGEGPMLGIAPLLSLPMVRRLAAVAEAQQIPLQTEVMGGETGTNADSIAAVRVGVRTAMLSIPQRYMHTPVEVVDPRDVEATARLIAAYVKEGVLA